MENRGLNSRPNLHKRLFWELRYEEIDWQKEYAVIIERVIERGTEEEWKELIHFYGRGRVLRTLKSETNYLPDEIILEVCRFFKLKPTDLKCYLRKQSTPGHWI